MRSIFFIVLCSLFINVYAQDSDSSKTPSLVRVKTGAVFNINDQMTFSHIARHQSYNGRDTLSYDKDIHSPKSVSLSPDGYRYYVNSLEGYTTVVYDARSHKKIAAIKHSFSKKDSALWAKPSGLYQFSYENKTANTFSGKPVESTFSHKGRYLWVPYYRRSFDINAQDPSAMAVIDTHTNQIIRLFETGALPKMVEASADGRWVAVSHWGENTVGLIDVQSESPEDWHYVKNFVIDYKLKLDFSRTVSVNRDVNSGYCLRGTVFTPDGRYLLVGCMGGNGGIAVIDLQTQTYLGRVLGMLPNLRHIVLKNGWMYLSINNRGAIQRIRLDKFEVAIPNMVKHKTMVEGWQTCEVARGARTISITPDGRYIYAACNTGSCLAIVDTKTFKMIGKIPVDSYPVGLEVSDDGSTVYVTSQGRNNSGGNAVNIFHVDYK